MTGCHHVWRTAKKPSYNGRPILCVSVLPADKGIISNQECISLPIVWQGFILDIYIHVYLYIHAYIYVYGHTRTLFGLWTIDLIRSIFVFVLSKASVKYGILLI